MNYFDGTENPKPQWKLDGKSVHFKTWHSIYFFATYRVCYVRTFKNPALFPIDIWPREPGASEAGLILQRSISHDWDLKWVFSSHVTVVSSCKISSPQAHYSLFSVTRASVVQQQHSDTPKHENWNTGMHTRLNAKQAKCSVWWPGISKYVQEIVSTCSVCQEFKPTQRRETLICTPLPGRPWEKVAADICQWK